jgi:YfiH family protein
MEYFSLNNIGLFRFSIFPQSDLFHFSSSIKGGVSTGAYSSLNLGLYSGDNPEHVKENRERIANVAGVPVENLYIPCQTHDDKTFVVDEQFLNLSDEEKEKKLYGIDALITDRKNICIGVTTADCVSVLIYDPHKEVLAAIHAGWKGTVARIAEKTVIRMTEHFGSNPKDLLAGIAPCISQERFEVGEEVVETFQEAGFQIEDIGYRNTETGKMHLNLQQTNKLILNDAGIPAQNIEIANLCTYSNPQLFFSARRQTIHSGRMVTGGILK